MSFSSFVKFVKASSSANIIPRSAQAAQLIFRCADLPSCCTAQDSVFEVLKGLVTVETVLRQLALLSTMPNSFLEIIPKLPLLQHSELQEVAAYARELQADSPYSTKHLYNLNLSSVAAGTESLVPIIKFGLLSCGDKSLTEVRRTAEELLTYLHRQRDQLADPTPTSADVACNSKPSDQATGRNAVYETEHFVNRLPNKSERPRKPASTASPLFSKSLRVAQSATTTLKTTGGMENSSIQMDWSADAYRANLVNGAGASASLNKSTVVESDTALATAVKPAVIPGMKALIHNIHSMLFRMSKTRPRHGKEPGLLRKVRGSRIAKRAKASYSTRSALRLGAINVASTSICEIIQMLNQHVGTPGDSFSLCLTAVVPLALSSHNTTRLPIVPRAVLRHLNEFFLSYLATQSPDADCSVAAKQYFQQARAIRYGLPEDVTTVPIHLPSTTIPELNRGFTSHLTAMPLDVDWSAVASRYLQVALKIRNNHRCRLLELPAELLDTIFDMLVTTETAEAHITQNKGPDLLKISRAMSQRFARFYYSRKIFLVSIFEPATKIWRDLTDPSDVRALVEEHRAGCFVSEYVYPTRILKARAEADGEDEGSFASMSWQGVITWKGQDRGVSCRYDATGSVGGQCRFDRVSKDHNRQRTKEARFRAILAEKYPRSELVRQC